MAFLLSKIDQSDSLRIVNYISNQAIQNMFYRFINHMNWHKEPFL